MSRICFEISDEQREQLDHYLDGTLSSEAPKSMRTGATGELMRRLLAEHLVPRIPFDTPQAAPAEPA